MLESIEFISLLENPSTPESSLASRLLVRLKWELPFYEIKLFPSLANFAGACVDKPHM